MTIWNGTLSLAQLNDLNKNTMGSALNINFTELGPDHLTAVMPVNENSRQPFGLLHGGASVALAETLGSVATWCVVNRELFIGVGMEINANHLKPVTEGFVTGVCKGIRISGKIHVWEIRIFDQKNELCCISRFTCMVVPKRS